MDFVKDLKSLKMKYDGIYGPYYEERSRIVNGMDCTMVQEEAGYQQELEVDNEHFVNDVLKDTNESRETIVSQMCSIDEKADAEVFGVPDFWLTTFANHPLLEQHIHEKDIVALQYLTNVSSKDEEYGFSVQFEFDGSNPYFQNSVLAKEYHVRVLNNGYTVSDFSVASNIDWKNDMNLCFEKVVSKGKHKKKQLEMEPVESFFHLFQNIGPVGPTENSEALEADFEIGITLHESVLPRAVAWFSGEEGDRAMSDSEDENNDMLLD